MYVFTVSVCGSYQFSFSILLTSFRGKDTKEQIPESSFKSKKNYGKLKQGGAGALVQWLEEGTHNQRVMSLNQQYILLENKISGNYSFLNWWESKQRGTQSIQKRRQRGKDAPSHFTAIAYAKNAYSQERETKKEESDEQKTSFFPPALAVGKNLYIFVLQLH